MLAALKEYAHGSDIDVFLIAKDLEYGIKEASVDQNILHTLMLFKHYELPWLQNDISGFAKPSWFSEVKNSPKLPVLTTDRLVYRNNAYKGFKYKLDWGRVGRPLSTTWRPRKGGLVPIKLPKGAPSIFFGGVDSCQGRQSEFEVVLPRFCSYRSEGSNIRVNGYGASKFQCQILMSWLPLIDFLLVDVPVPVQDDVTDLWDDLQTGDGTAINKLGHLLEMRLCKESFYAKKIAENDDYLVVNLFGEGNWELVGGNLSMAKVENTVFIINKNDSSPRKRVRLLSTAIRFVNHTRHVL